MAEDQYKILMIDDEEDIIDFFGKSFESFPHIQFFSALRASQGIEIAKTEKPQVVLLDLRMPGMNGEEAISELHKSLPESKFVVMTGWEDGHTRERVEKMPGVAAFFLKPVDLEKIITKIMSLMMVKE